MRGMLRLAALASVALCCVAGEARAGATEDKPIADVLQWLIPLTGLTLTGAYNDPEGTTQFAESYLTTVSLTAILKRAHPEQRPNGSQSQESYVSGHTSSAFAGAAFIQMRYGWALGLPAYLGAIFTGHERIEERAHYPADVERGAALALIDAWIFVRPFHGRGAGAALLTPWLGPHEVGLNLVATW
jgi:membrane-associated phospholipid phosphatase